MRPGVSTIKLIICVTYKFVTQNSTVRPLFRVFAEAIQQVQFVKLVSLSIQLYLIHFFLEYQFLPI